MKFENIVFNSYKNSEINYASYINIIKPLKKTDIIFLSKLIKKNNKLKIINVCFYDSKYYIEFLKILEKIGFKNITVNFIANINIDNIDDFTKLKKYEKNFKINITYTDNAEKIVKNGISDICSLKQYLDMNKIITFFYNSIQNYNYTNFEKVLYAYDIVKSYKYAKEDHSEDYRVSRALHQVIYGEKIVCTGYATLFSALLSRLNIKNSVYSTSVLTSDEKVEGHRRVVVNIIDDKYNISGIFICDPTWDSRKSMDIKYNQLNRYTYFMLPIEKSFNFYRPENINAVNSVFLNLNNIKSYHKDNSIDIYEKLGIDLSIENDDDNIQDDYDKYNLIITKKFDKLCDIIKNFKMDYVSFEKILNATMRVRIEEGVYLDNVHLQNDLYQMIMINANNEKKAFVNEMRYFEIDNENNKINIKTLENKNYHL